MNHEHGHNEQHAMVEVVVVEAKPHATQTHAEWAEAGSWEWNFDGRSGGGR